MFLSAVQNQINSFSTVKCNYLRWVIEKIIHHKLFKQILKFGSASVIATLVDICLFRFVFFGKFELFYAELAAAFCGMLVNFFLQKKYVFKLERNALVAFLLSLGTSLVVMTLGATLMTKLVNIPLFAQYIMLPKLIVVGLKFVFNFFTKKWVFEKTLK